MNLITVVKNGIYLLDCTHCQKQLLESQKGYFTLEKNNYGHRITINELQQTNICTTTFPLK